MHLYCIFCNIKKKKSAMHNLLCINIDEFISMRTYIISKPIASIYFIPVCIHCFI